MRLMSSILRGLVLSVALLLAACGAESTAARPDPGDVGIGPFPDGLVGLDGFNPTFPDSSQDSIGGGESGSDEGGAGAQDGGDTGSGGDSGGGGGADSGPGSDTGPGPDGEGSDTIGGADVRSVIIDAPLDLSLIAERTGGGFAATWHVRLQGGTPWPDVHAPDSPHFDPTTVEQFGGEDSPPANEILVHAYEGWDQGGPVILLAHGAGGWGAQTYGDFGLVPGMGSLLALKGYAVFAITFPHRFGDVRNQAAQLAAGLQWARVKGQAAQASVVAHSKACVAAVSYASGHVASGGFPYAGEIHTMVLLGGPLGGMDYTFRHPNVAASMNAWGGQVPSAWEFTYLGILETDNFDKSIYHPGYLGLQQLLWPYIDDYPLSMLEQDWYTTWHGGQGFVSKSRGIAATIELGGDFMESLRKHKVPAAISVGLGVGGNPWVNGVMWETDGPSDGLVFEKSAGDTALFEDPSNVTVQTFPLTSHPFLVTDPTVLGWIETLLP